VFDYSPTIDSDNNQHPFLFSKLGSCRGRFLNFFYGSTLWKSANFSLPFFLLSKQLLEVAIASGSIGMAGFVATVIRTVQSFPNLGPSSACSHNSLENVAIRLSQQWSVVGYYRFIPSHGNNHWGGIGWMSRQ
jgi:hypothetical protein